MRAETDTACEPNNKYHLKCLDSSFFVAALTWTLVQMSMNQFPAGMCATQVLSMSNPFHKWFYSPTTEKKIRYLQYLGMSQEYCSFLLYLPLTLPGSRRLPTPAMPFFRGRIDLTGLGCLGIGRPNQLAVPQRCVPGALAERRWFQRWLRITSCGQLWPLISQLPSGNLT